MAVFYKIHPAIGIARLGNSPESYPGPTLPGVYTPPASYRDGAKNLKRQSVSFSVYAYDDANPNAEPLKVKVGPNETVKSIQWTVHVANKKAAWFDFDGLTGANDILNPPNFGYPPGSLRNSTGSSTDWTIDPGPRGASAPGSVVAFGRNGSNGTYPETWPQPFQNGNSAGIDTLGQMKVEPDSSLTVLGGFGNSGSINGSGIVHYANNPGWFDDASDGSVQAQLVSAKGTEDAVPAWVIVGPPDFAPPIENIVTLYDAIYDVGLRFCKLDPAIFDPNTNQFRSQFTPSFENDVYPILARAFNYRWVYDNNSPPMAPTFHTSMGGASLTALSTPPAAGNDPNLSSRQTIFHRLRNPNAGQNNNFPGNMPKLHSDLGDGPQGALKFTLTITQFEIMRRWAEGQFTFNGGPLPSSLPNQITAAGLDRAVLQAAVGGAFFPGIECSWIVREPKLYLSPFQFRFRVAGTGDPNGLSPGDVTKRSACPWQADFYECGHNWWPAQRPNQVRTSLANADYHEWDDGINADMGMVQGWHELGIVKYDSPSGVYFEDERNLGP